MEEAKRDEEESKQQQIWSWGAGTEGQLGTGKLEDEYLPQLLHLPFLSSAESISTLACGGAHVIALTSGGRVFTWGRGTTGQLGHGEMLNSLHPKPVSSLQSYVITQVSAGWSHSGFVSDIGLLFTCGDGSFGQLGQGDYRSQSTPVKVDYFTNNFVNQIACGMRHSLVLLNGGRVFTWGRGTTGQLGHGEMLNSLHPKPVSSLQSYVITQVSAGWSHSGFVSDTGLLFTCGDGSFGQLGQGDYRSQSTPVKVDYFANNFVNQIACGMRHSLVLLNGNQVYGFGSGKRGQLGISKDKIKSINLPQVTCGLEDVQIVSISANGDHSAAIDKQPITKQLLI
ncbi:hypothetical protein D5086_027282 [Populus alba]|uniref:Uncharacterized protein n=1 Tax=Populus alba TaxID=43335 RepID=A0ACC4AW94_POPAL